MGEQLRAPLKPLGTISPWYSRGFRYSWRYFRYSFRYSGRNCSQDICFCDQASGKTYQSNLIGKQCLLSARSVVCKDGTTTAIWCLAVREPGVSLQLRASLNPLVPPQLYRIEGFKGSPQLAKLIIAIRSESNACCLRCDGTTTACRYWENYVSSNLVIAIPVNWRITASILTRKACYPSQNTCGNASIY